MSLAEELIAAVGESGLVLDGSGGAPIVRPGSDTEAAWVLALAARRQLAVAVRGAGSKAHLGHPVQAGLILETLRLNRVVEYNAADLTVTVGAGMRFTELQALLARQQQWVALDPPRAEQATIGGIVAAASSGPRRLLYGAPRDLVLGMRIALTDGTVVKSGGRVVKNVAGYDMNKLFIGSMGTLGVMTEVTLKVRPLPVARRTLVLGFSGRQGAHAVARAVLHAELIPAALEYLSPEIARRLGLGGHCLAAALEEVPAAIDYQDARLRELAAPHGLEGVRELTGDQEAAFWRTYSDLDLQLQPAAVIKLNLLMSQVGGAAERVEALAGSAGLPAGSAGRMGSGMLYAYIGDSGSDPGAVAGVLTALQAYAQEMEGTAAIEWATPAIRERVALWGKPRPEQFLFDGLKRRYDPDGILNPGRYIVSA